MAFQCPRCSADPTPARLTQPRRCAFDANGGFNRENWNCATIAYLLGHPLAQDFLGESESLQFVPNMTEVVDEHGAVLTGETMQDGWLILTRDGRQGTVSSMVYVGTFHPPAEVSLAQVEECLEGLRKQAQLSTGLVTVQ